MQIATGNFHLQPCPLVDMQILTYLTNSKARHKTWLQNLAGVTGLGHVPRPRRHIYENLVFKSGLPCDLPLAALTSNQLRWPQVEVRTSIKQNAQAHGLGILFGRGDRT